MITFDQASKRCPDRTVALDRLSMVAPTGQATVLVGASGGGKTTALRMVNRMTEPTWGRYRHRSLAGRVEPGLAPRPRRPGAGAQVIAACRDQEALAAVYA